MDQIHIPDTTNLAINGTAIRPRSGGSRPTSARSTHSQSNHPLTLSQEGSARDQQTSVNNSVHLSSARQRRHSNSSQRSLQMKSPPGDIKQSTSSSVFNVLSPRRDEADGFFTDQDQTKSLARDEEQELNETRQWVEELHQLNQLIPSNEAEVKQPIGHLGMSRDSLNGTLAGTHLLQTTDNRQATFIPSAPVPQATQPKPQVFNSQDEQASVKIQRWYREQRTRPTQTRINQQTKKPERPSTPIKSMTRSQTDEPGSRTPRPGSASSTASRHRATPLPSSRPPSRHEQRRPSKDVAIPSVSSSSSSSSKVILDDIYETLKKLEEVEQFPRQPPIHDDAVYLTGTNTRTGHLHERKSNNFTPESVRSGESTPRANDIGTPPPSVRRNSTSNKGIQSASLPQSRVSTPIHQTNRYDRQTPASSKSVIVSMSPRGEFTDPRSRTTQDMRDKLQQWKSVNQHSELVFKSSYELPFNRSHQSESEFDRQLQIQREEYEARIQNHLQFIDQLIEDKKKLAARCEKVEHDYKTLEKKTSDRLRSLEQFHRLELQRLKDVHDAAEKLRREQWIESKTKKLKELTVRGLEPEIQKLIEKHKNELTKLKTIHQAELLTADERASQRYINLTDELRDQLEREKQEAIARERELAREKYEKAIRDEQDNFVEQRRRLFVEIDEEKTRQNELIQKQRADLEKLRRDIEENHRNAVETNKREYETMFNDQQRRYQKEIEELQEKYTRDQQIYHENLQKQQDLIITNKERELREQMKRERDGEIERIIAQFESDTHSTQEETERTADNRVKRIREKYESEFRELETSERQTKERYNQIRTQLTEIQGEYERLQIFYQQKETELEETKKVKDVLQNERERFAEIIRQEFADRLVTTDDENRRLKVELAELRARQKLELEKKNQEIENLRRQQDRELETLQQKIQQAVAKKDESVQNLRAQYEAAIQRAAHFEQLLAQQRKSLAATLPSKKFPSSS